MGNTTKHDRLGDKIKHFFTDTIGGRIKKVWNWVKGTVKGTVRIVHDDVKKVTSTLYEDAKGLVSGVSKLVVKTKDMLSGTVKEVAKDATTLGSNVSHNQAIWPCC
jgi:phage-related protein